jgi:REP-associated tyrosine transposase
MAGSGTAALRAANCMEIMAPPSGTTLVSRRAMSHPRSILPGATYLITRRTLLRHMLLRPDAEINRLIVYVLAVSARRHGVQVHAFCAMSTHLHLVVTDVQGRLPQFLQLFHRLVALGAKVLRAWEGPLWDHEPTSLVLLTTRDAVVEKIAYTLANPVAAGLVRLAREWPGAKTLVEEIGCGVMRAARPVVFFNPANPAWPAIAELPLVLPLDIDAESIEEFRRAIARKVTHEEMERRGSRVLGVERAVKISPYQRATSFEDSQRCNPTFAVGHANGEAWRRAASAVRAFRSAYRHALEGWRAGVRSVMFPAGTWWMRVLHAATVDELALV